MFDQRGVLRSDGVREDEPLTVDMLVDDCENIRKELDISRIIPLGHSYGGLIALLYARRYDAYTDSVIYENPNWSSMEAMKAILYNHCIYLDKIGEKELSGRVRCQMASCHDLCLLESLLAEIPEAYRAAVYCNKPWTQKILDFCHLENITGEQWHNSEIHHSKIMADAINTRNLLQITGEIQCPQLLLRGEHDPCMPPEFQEYFINKAGGTCITIEDCGHYIHTDRPEAFCRAVMQFIESGN